VSLVVDNRAALAGAPGLHALIIGVSEYPFLAGGGSPVPDPWGMPQLTSTASTAHKIFQWLTSAQLPVPLATVQLLLSPALSETHLAGVGDPATLDNVIVAADAWRTAASDNRDGYTFFYFAGHGIQRTKEDAVLCLHDFRRPPFGALHHAIDLLTLRTGMSPAPGREDIARTQFYFLDACRVQPEQQRHFEPMTTSAVFDKDLAGEDDRRSPVFYSSISNMAALAIPGQQTLFSRALIDCLNGVGADSLGEDENGNDRWGVTVTGLDRGLKLRIEELNRELQADQTYTQGGQFTQATLCVLTSPPLVDVELSIDPEAARLVGELVVTTDGDVVCVQKPAPVSPHPVKGQLKAGLYRVSVVFNAQPPPFGNFSKLKKAESPRVTWKVTVP
jgi:hypothetical protein